MSFDKIMSISAVSQYLKSSEQYSYKTRNKTKLNENLNDQTKNEQTFLYQLQMRLQQLNPQTTSLSQGKNGWTYPEQIQQEPRVENGSTAHDFNDSGQYLDRYI